MKPKGKQKFEVKRVSLLDGTIEQSIYIDGELFDWGVDDASLEMAYKMGPEIYEAAQRDIEKHFVESMCEFLHRKVTMQDIFEAMKTGWI